MANRPLSTLLILALAFCLAALFGCTNRNLVADADPDLGSIPDQTSTAGNGKGQLSAGFIAWMKNPGTPGVDYSPTRIIASYKRGAKAPSSLPVGTAPAQQLASQMPNKILRVDKSFEPLTDAIASSLGLKIKNQVYDDFSSWASFDVPEGLDPQTVLDQLRSSFAQQLEYACFAPLMHKAYTPNDPDFSKTNRDPWIAPPVQWGHRIVNCTQAWDHERGDPSIIVAVIDDAFEINHEELVGSVINPATDFPFSDSNCDVADNDKDVTPADAGVGVDLGHGTMVIGLAAAQGNNLRTIAGVAWGCRFLPIKHAQSATGDQMADDSTAAINLAVALGAKVINCSWGSNTYVEIIVTAIDSATSQGVLVVCAAGNGNTTQSHYPSALSYAFAVGSTGYLPPGSPNMSNWQPDTKADHSNYGSYVDIAAPGVFMKTTAMGGVSEYDDWAGGTSMASPLVAGAAGLLFSRNPILTVSECRSFLQSTGAPTVGFTQGTVNRLDIGAAILAALPGFVVSGSVETGEGLPLEGANVTLSSFGSTNTDSAGEFVFIDVPDDSYTVSVTFSGMEFEPALRDISVSTGHVTGLWFLGFTENEPRITGLVTEEGEVGGVLAGMLVAGVYGAGNVDRMRYILDLSPVGEVDSYDIDIETSADGPVFYLQLDVSDPAIRNQKATLVGIPIHSDGTEGGSRSVDVYIFNHLGDANADGVVDLTDFDGFAARLGMRSGDPGYIPFYDSDLDGIITEADAAAVGYFLD